MKDNLKHNRFTIYITGGLGNQLFQYAAGFSYASKYRKYLVINTDQYYGYQWNEGARFVLNKVVKNLPIDPPAKWTGLMNGPLIHTYIGRVCRKLFLQKGKVFREKESFVYDDKLTEDDGFDGLSGYFQNPHYFRQYSDEILANITPSIITEEALEFARVISKAHTSVAIHYRDYGDSETGNEKVKETMGEPEIEYYQEAIDLFNMRSKDTQYYVFSNNIQSARTKFGNMSNLEFFDYKSKFQWEDMVLMSMCNHNIICNSSYSWWSAYLNSNKDKVVVAPKKWGNSLKENYPGNLGLYPKSWIQL